MQKSPFREDGSCLSGQEISCLLWNSTVHCHVLKSAIGSHPEPGESSTHLHTFPSHPF